MPLIRSQANTSRPLRSRFTDALAICSRSGALGGRAAERLVYGIVTTGAENDLQQVTRLAHEMVVRWGMSEKVGPVSFTENSQGAFGISKPYSEGTALMIDSEVRRIAEECMVEACRLLTEHRPLLDTLARALLREDSLNEAEILEVTGIRSQNPRKTGDPD